jgi:hypothetical protein
MKHLTAFSEGYIPCAAAEREGNSLPVRCAMLSGMSLPGFYKYLMITEAASTSETSVTFHRTTGPKNPEDNHLYTRSRENLRPQVELTVLAIQYRNKLVF